MASTMHILRNVSGVTIALVLALLLGIGFSCSPDGTVNPLAPANSGIIVFAAFTADPAAVSIGGDAATLTALLVNAEGEPVADHPVAVIAAHGSIQPVDTLSNADGIYHAQYTSAATAGIDTIVAILEDERSRFVRDTLYLDITSYVMVSLAADDTLVVADGISSTTITATVQNPAGRVQVGQQIYFAASRGAITESAITDNMGQATATYTSAPLAATITTRITASADQSLLKSALAVGEVDTLQLTLTGVSLTMTASELALEVSSPGPSTLLATLQTVDGIPLAGQPVSFVTNFGTLSSQSGITDAAGQVRSSLLAPAETGYATVQVFYGAGLSAAVGVNVYLPTGNQPTRLYLSVLPGRLLADGESTAELRAIVLDSLNNAVSDGTTVGFEILNGGSGRVEQFSTTTSGEATATLTAGFTPDTVQVRAYAGTATDTVMVTYGSRNLTLSASPTQIDADGVSQSTITAILKNESNNPVEGALVTFSTTRGTIPGFAVTNANGEAQVALTSESVSGITTVTAQSDDINLMVDVAFIAAVEVPVTQIILTATPDRILADGKSTTSIRAVVLDSLNNTAPDGTPVEFIVLDGGSGSIDHFSTTSGGEALAELTAGFLPDSVLVQAVSGQAADTVMVVYGGLDLMVSANPITVNADGISTSSITAVVRNELNNPVANQTVTFSSTFGTIPASAVTDAGGNAQVVFISERLNGLAVISAHLDALTAQATVTMSGVTMSLSATPSSALADGQTPVIITGTLRDAASVPIDDAAVQVTANLGNLSLGAGSTNAGGIFTDTLRSSTSGDVMVTMTAAGATGSVTVPFTGYSLSVSANPASVVAGVDTATITAALLGQNIDGIEMIFSSSFGTLVSQESVTDANGLARALYTSNSAGTAVITIAARSNGNILTETEFALTIDPAPAANIHFNVSPRVVEVNGATATMTATVTDARGNPVPDARVSYSLLTGPGDIAFAPLAATTNAVGVATSTFTSGAVGSQERDDITVQARVQGTDVVSNVISMTISGPPAQVTLGTSDATDNGDGTFSLSISSIVTDVNGNAVSDGMEIFYSVVTADGTAQGVGVVANGTTTNGQAIGSLRYPSSDAGAQVIIGAETSNGIAVADTVILPGTANEIVELRFQTPSSTSILADGNSTTNITVVALDADGEPVPNRVVDFSYVIDGQTFDADFDQTNPVVDAQGNILANGGQASVPIQSIASAVDIFPEFIAETENVTARLDTMDENSVVFLGIDFQMSVDADTIEANQSATVQVNLKETTTQVAITFEEITFGTSLGSIVQSSLTDNTGSISTVELNAGTQTGTAIITATMGSQLIRRDTVEIVAEIASVPAVLTLSTNETSLIATGGDGVQQAQITAALLDGEGNAVSDGTEVTFTTDLGTFANGLTSMVVETTDGSAVAVLTSGSVTGIVTITASAASLTQTKSLLTIQNNPAITLSNNNTFEDLGNGVRRTTVSALLKRNNSALVADGTGVTFYLAAGNPAAISGVTTTTNGIALGTVTYTENSQGVAVEVRVRAIIDAVVHETTLLLVLP
jgi:adhesin/invasin